MCTNVSLKCKDGTVVVGRTMDFASKTGMLWGEFTDAAIKFKGKFSDINYGLGHVRTMSDGFNEAGLSLATLWLPATTFHNALQPGDGDISGLTLPQAILGTCKTIKDVVSKLTGKRLTLPAKFIDQYATVHLTVTEQWAWDGKNDKTPGKVSGKTLVVEFGTDGKAPGIPTFYYVDQDISVLTNAPTYPWQLQNLSNYVRFQKYNTTDAKINGIDYGTTGFGNNQQGLPADATPPSRFALASVLLNLATDGGKSMPRDADEAMGLLSQVLAKVSVIAGTSVNKTGALTADHADSTIWTVLKNLNTYEMYQLDEGKLGYQKLVCEKVKSEATPLSELTEE